MILDFLLELGTWNWILFGLILLILEILAPGIFFIWFAIAALVTGCLAFLFSSTIGFGWHWQTVLFLSLAIVFVLIGRRIFSGRKIQTEPLLNQRGEQLVGLRSTLSEPIINGRGRIWINDTIWRVTGPDLPIGTQVHIVSFDPVNLELEVEP